jgi:AcrR family transcriptional regulator
MAGAESKTDFADEQTEMSGTGTLHAPANVPEVAAMAKGSIDRRAARTRAMLHHAMMSLVRQKDYDAITVQDICEAARVGRSTFYGHFASKDDLKRSGLDEHLRRLIHGRLENERPENERLENAAAASGRGGGRRLAFSLPMFEHAREHIETYRALAGTRGGEVALGAIRAIVADLLRRELAVNPGQKSGDAMPRELVVEIVVGAYMTALTWWLDGGATMPPRQIDAMFRRLATDGLFCEQRPAAP